MQNEASVVIDRPIDEVFWYTNERVAEWSKTVTSVEPLGDKQHGVGARARICTEDGGHKMEFDSVVVAWEPPTTSAVKMMSKQLDIVAHYTFEDRGGSTEVTQRSMVRGKGWVRLVMSCFGWLMKKRACKSADNELLSLKRLLEAGAAESGADEPGTADTGAAEA